MPVGTLAVEAVTATEDTSVMDLVETMHEEELGCLVIEADHKPVGVVTDRDVMVAMAEFEDLTSVTAAEIMAADPVTIHEDATACDLPAAMADAGVRRMPVVDDAGDLVGIATMDDVVATLGEMLKDVATVIEMQSPAFEPGE